MQRAPLAERSPSAEKQLPRKERMGRFISQFGMVAAFVFMVIVFSVFSRSFFTVGNFINIANQTATVSVIAFGMTMVMLAGGIDLSVGSLVSLSAVVCALLLGGNMATLPAMLISLAIGMAFGFVNGFISVRWAIQPFLVTLGSLSVARGLSLILSGGRTVYINVKPFLALTGRGSVGPIPVLFLWTLFFLAVSWILMTQTTFGRRVRAVGGNLVAARQAGLQVNWIRIKVFMLSGVFAAFAGLMLAGRLSSGLPSVGSGMELDAIAASVLGGTGFKGEGGSLVGTLFGALVLGTVINGLTILGVNPYIQEVVKGVIIVLAVLIANIRRQKGER
jgi:ribose/xylose/arabinose/galactoside ABC-type transport system permease subunit